MAEMERTASPVLGRQRSVSVGGPTLLHSRSTSRHEAGSGSFNSLRRGQNYAAKAAAARLAQVMQANRDFGSDEEDEDDVIPHYTPPYIASVAAVESRREPSPRVARGAAVESRREPAPRVAREADVESRREPAPRVARGADVESRREPAPRVARGAAVESQREPAPRVIDTARAPNSRGSTLRPTPAQPAASFQRPKPVIASVPAHLRDPAPQDRLHKHISDPTPLSTSCAYGARREAAALLDEIDMLQEDNESLFDRLRLAEEKLAEKDFRTRELERQVMSVGQQSGDSSMDLLDSRLRSRKEQFLKQREAVLRAAKEQSEDVKDEEIAALKLEVEAAREEAAAASAAAHEVETEVKALRTMTHRMTLTQEEMEEVVLKRCWLARYWGLAAKHGIHPEIASSKSDFWSSLAPLPLEVVLSAGQGPSSQNKNTTSGQRTRDVNDITGEGNIESLLAVEKGLRELAALKVEDAVMLALSRHRRTASLRDSTDSPKAFSSVELSPVEIEDVQFKQAWLVYFWRRAKANGLETVRAEECIQLWNSRSMLQTSVRDQVDVERGMMELRALGIEEQLWNISRREISKDAANHKVDVLEVLQGNNSLQRTLSSSFLPQ